MALLLTTFKYQGQLQSVATDAGNDAILAEVIAKIKEGIVELSGYEQIHYHDFDHQCEDEAVDENQTLFEIRLIVNTDTTDMNDGGEDLYHYVLDDLELCMPHITYISTCGDKPIEKTIIGIDVKYAHNPDVQYTDYNEMMYTQQDGNSI